MSLDPIDRQRITELAFDLWCKRGRPLGSAELDWERAEELLAHDSGIYPAMRLEQSAAAEDQLDGDGLEARDPAPKVFGL